MNTFPIRYPGAPLPQAGMPEQVVLAIGDFDGVHQGHQQVIRRAVERAKQAGLPSAMMTFDPHPRLVLGHTQYEACLTPLTVKLEIMESLGLDYAYVVDFHEQFSRLTAAQFVEEVLLPLGVHSVVVGFDFSFGYQGRGTPDTLAEMGHKQFAVEVIRPFHLHGEKVSSTRVRENLLSGRVKEANELLGRPYRMRGKVVTGEQRGRKLDFPTANIELAEPYFLPPNGVYAVTVTYEGEKSMGAANLGIKPTFSDQRILPVLEVHLLDFSGDLYGQTLDVEFHAFIRKEKKFPSIDHLVSQIRKDVRRVREELSFVLSQKESG
ncbi:bifunctional riboflavin kinase/FAD synthetase [Paenibacillus senegalensis]|uniref:bifunctional riboflavin kinase/FAD synthetase n=1 Tax=Paenibacillus senegalensis TaxID=1465766 RepID=UPI000288F35C|nr:bifunctional riboflavin kinase/FAD synthetase [Paenibacillus senegalensis]